MKSDICTDFHVKDNIWTNETFLITNVINNNNEHLTLRVSDIK